MPRKQAVGPQGRSVSLRLPPGGQGGLLAEQEAWPGRILLEQVKEMKVAPARKRGERA